MQYLGFTVLILLLLYVVTYFKSKNSDFSFLSKDHTQLLRGIAIIVVVLSHMGHKFGMRYLAPLGGTGVSIFLILSAYGLLESYKKHGLAGFWTKRLLKVFIPYLIIQTYIYI